MRAVTTLLSRIWPLLLAMGLLLPSSMLAPRHALAHRSRTPARLRVAHPIRVAVTIDDLPGGGPEIGGFTHPRIVADIIAALRAHGVRNATGFVVGSMLEGHPERRAALDSWVEAGFEVGNHTYSHVSLAEVGLDAYLKDVEANQPLISELEKRTGQRAHYFRCPYLEEGNTEADRRALLRFLSAHGYKLARVSIDFDDWAWADAYNRCMQQNDTQALQALSQTYLDNGKAWLAWAVAAAREVLGHPITQVLLLHANAATAQNLDALLSAYDRMGVRFVPLSEALASEVYSASYEFGGANVLAQASHRLGRPLPPWLAQPMPLIDVLCR